MRDTEFLVIEFQDEPGPFGRRVLAVWHAPFEAEARHLWADLIASGEIKGKSALVEVPSVVAATLKHQEKPDG